MRSKESQVSTPAHHIRLALCCQFVREPIKFRTTTATAMMRFSREEQLSRLSQLCLINADALTAALSYCAQSGIGGFRINSQILPLKTHPVVGYETADLPNAAEVVARFRACGDLARAHDIRTSFHPDQFVVLNSPNQTTVARSIAELEYQAEVACWVGADTINIHAGGAYGDKSTALKVLRQNIDGLKDPVRSRLTIENDDRIFTPSDLIAVCRDLQVPLVYDVHHHRCLPDEWTVDSATEKALTTWNREPLFHLSSPLHGWRSPDPERHHGYINPRDFPACWNSLTLTVEVEAKAKELAVLRLLRSMTQQV